MVKYVMGCAIGMQLHFHGLPKHLRHGLRNRVQLHSHGLVKTYVMMDCARGVQLHSHGLVKNFHHLNTESHPENHYVNIKYVGQVSLAPSDLRCNRIPTV